MASLRKRGRVWYYRYVDANGMAHERKGCPDKRETEAMAAALEAEAFKIKAGLIDPKALGYRAHEARPLADHLADFRKSLDDKGGTARHTQMTASRAEKMLVLAGARRVSDLTLSKAQAALAALRSEGLGMETINHYVRAVKAFSRWLWRDGRAREHALAHLATSSSEPDRRRRRRALIPEEAARLVQAAESGPTVKGMTGPDRARLYSLALGTGLRASELGSLTPERFDLTASPPTATVPAAYTKNGKEAVQPLPPDLADHLAPWLATLPTDRPVFNLTDRTAEMIQVDLAAAGIPYETASGRVDFHALRGCYVSYIVSSGASVKTCQTLARHSTPSLTIGVYAKASLHDITGAVSGLPDLTPTAAHSEAAKMTGTDGSAVHIKNYRAHPLPIGGDGTGRELSVAVASDDVNLESSTVFLMERNPLENEGFGASGRALSAPGGGSCERRELNPHALRHRNLNPTCLPVPPLSRTHHSTIVPRPETNSF